MFWLIIAAVFIAGYFGLLDNWLGKLVGCIFGALLVATVVRWTLPAIAVLVHVLTLGRLPEQYKEYIGYHHTHEAIGMLALAVSFVMLLVLPKDSISLLIIPSLAAGKAWLFYILLPATGALLAAPLLSGLFQKE